MKYLEDDGLSRMTTRLRREGRGRLITGRLEAYTMKRAGLDKKYAAEFGQKALPNFSSVLPSSSLDHHNKEQVENGSAAPANINNNKNNQSFAPSSSCVSTSATNALRKRSTSVGLPVEAAASLGEEQQRPARKKARSRAISFDEFFLKKGRSLDDDNNKPGTSLQQQQQQPPQDLASRRRLLTDLILTLNMSFPDYDFSCVKPSDFELLNLETFMGEVHSQLSNVLIEDSALLTELWASMDKVMKLADCEVYKWNAGDFRSSLYEDDDDDDNDDDDVNFDDDNGTYENAENANGRRRNNGEGYNADVVDLITVDHSEEQNNNTEESGGGVVTPVAVQRTPAEVITATTTTTSATCLWNFNYLIVNTKNLKRILFFSCHEKVMMQHHVLEEEDDIDDIGIGVHGGYQQQQQEQQQVISMRECDDKEDADFDLDPEAVTAGGLPISTV